MTEQTADTKGKESAKSEGGEASALNVVSSPSASPAASSSKKKRAPIASGRAYIHASFNNTIITMTDQVGNAVSWASAGQKGFRGSRKNTPFAAQVAAEEAARKAVDRGMRLSLIHI